jgi:hypothetical protein
MREAVQREVGENVEAKESVFADEAVVSQVAVKSTVVAPIRAGFYFTPMDG